LKDLLALIVVTPISPGSFDIHVLSGFITTTEQQYDARAIPRVINAITLSFRNFQFPYAFTDGTPLTFQTEFQAVEPDQYPRLCPTVSKSRKPIIERDAPIAGPVFQDIYRHLECEL